MYLKKKTNLLNTDADGDYQITTRSKAYIRYDGIVKWVC